MELVVEQLKLINPLIQNRSPFYILMETSGSDEEHDKQVCEILIHHVLKLVFDLVEIKCIFRISV